MKQDYWDSVAESFEDEIFNVLLNDKAGLIAGKLDKYGSRRKRVSDIGCGIGGFMPNLSRRFKHVLAVDISPKCIARAKITHKSLTNVSYRTADLAKPRIRLPKVDLCLCVNVLLTPSLAHRRRMLSAIARHIAPRGHLILVVPSLESAMLTHSRLIEWNLKDGTPASHATTARFSALSNKEARQLRAGIVHVDNVPHKHYLKEEMESLLPDLGMKALEAEKIEYPWDSEFIDPPQWMADPYPWDWLFVAQKK